MLKLNKLYNYTVNLIYFFLYIFSLLYILYIIYNYGFVGSLEKKYEKRRQRIEYAKNYINYL